MNNPSCISRKGKKRTTKRKLDESLASQSNHSSWLIFHLAFVFHLTKIKMGYFFSLSLSLSNISGTRRFKGAGKKRKRWWGPLTWKSAYVLGKKDAMAGTAGLQQRPGWQGEPWAADSVLPRVKDTGEASAWENVRVCREPEVILSILYRWESGVRKMSERMCVAPQALW